MTESGSGLNRAEEEIIDRKIMVGILIKRVKIGEIPFPEQRRGYLASDLRDCRIYESPTGELGSVRIRMRRIRHGSAGSIEIRWSTAGET